jgi:oxygen-independent coproporphyrinogen-3 oxidase
LDLDSVATKFGAGAVSGFSQAIADFVAAGLIERREDTIRLTARGRLLSNEVFERFILTGAPVLQGS